jgi:methylated-DNA-[protein]-cysteine S-methyltransferase
MPSAPDTATGEQYTLVHTAIGVCGLAWNARGLTRVQLPERSADHTEARLQRRPAIPATGPEPSHIAAAADALRRYSAGSRESFADVALDFSTLSTHDAAIYRALRNVGWGHTTTYGALAAAIGEPHAARAVGAAMARNAWPIIVPCHRVLAANGAMGGFSAYGGTMTKRALLALEGNGLDMLPLFAP